MNQLIDEWQIEKSVNTVCVAIAMNYHLDIFLLLYNKG